MASVTNNMTRISGIDTTDSWTTANVPSGGGGAGANTDIVLQGNQSLGRRQTTTGGTPAGYALIDAADNDCSAAGTHVGMWIWVTQYAILQTLRVILCTGTTPSTNYNYWALTVTNYPAMGGWVRVWVDVTTGTTGAGTYTSSQTRCYGVMCSFTGTPGGTSPNLILDSADYITGAALTLTGASGLWTDFTTSDQTVANQYGVLRVVGGVYNCWARIQLGSASSLIFTDSNFAIVFVDQEHVSTTFMGINVDLQHASTDIDWTNSVVRSAGTKKGDLVITGSSGHFDASGMTLAALRIITLTSVCSLTNSTIVGCGQITSAGANLNGTKFSGYEGSSDTSYIGWNVNTDPQSNLANCVFTKGAASTHAIEFGANSPATIHIPSTCTFSGYNASNSQTDSTVYINKAGGNTVDIYYDGILSYKSAGATVNIHASQPTLTIAGNVSLSGAEVRIYDLDR